MILHSNLGNLGDNLILTPLLRTGAFTRVQMPDDRTTRSAAQVYAGIAPVEFVPPGSITHIREMQGERIHRAVAYLRVHHLENCNPIPWMVRTGDEMVWAIRCLSDLMHQHGKSNLLAVNFTTMNAGGDRASAARAIPRHIAEHIVAAATARGYQCVNIGVSSNHTPMPGVIDLLDLNVRQAAACYALIGRYVGGESGPVHLMIANGGRVIVLHPDIDPLYYPGWMCHYTDEMFATAREPVNRARYVNKRSYRDVENLLGFDWTAGGSC